MVVRLGLLIEKRLFYIRGVMFDFFYGFYVVFGLCGCLCGIRSSFRDGSKGRNCVFGFFFYFSCIEVGCGWVWGEEEILYFN